MQQEPKKSVQAPLARPRIGMPRARKGTRKLPKTATEPALVRGAVVAVLSVLAAFGVKWAANVNQVQIEVLAAAIPAVALGVAWLIRFAVTANVKVITRLQTSTGDVVAGDAAALPTGAAVPVVDGETRTVVPVQLAA